MTSLTALQRSLSNLSIIVYLAIIGVISVVANSFVVLSYTGVSGLKSLWSNTSGFFTLWSGNPSTYTLDFQDISESTQTVAIHMPIIFGACAIIAMLTGAVYGIAKDFRMALIVAIVGIMAVLGIVLLEDIVVSLLGG